MVVENDLDEHDAAEVHLVARGIATAVAPETGLTDVQADLLEAIASAPHRRRRRLPGARARSGPTSSPTCSPRATSSYRQRIVHHMVLGELVLRPIPTVVAHRVAKYAEALGVKDDFVRVARRYAQGAYGLAWMDLQRSGFVEHVQDVGDEETGARHATGRAATAPFEPAGSIPSSRRAGRAFEDLPDGSLGRLVWEMYDGRGFALPGTPGGAPAYLAQHDFVHVLADYGTNLKGELEVFALHRARRSRPEGLRVAGHAHRPLRDGLHPDDRLLRPRRQRARHPGAGHAPAHRRRDPARQGGVRALRRRPVRRRLLRARGAARSTRCARCSASRRSRAGALQAGCVGPFDLEGMSETQRRAARATSRRRHVTRNFTQTISVRCDDPGADHRVARASGISTRPRPTSWATWARACSPTATTPVAT